MATGRQLGGETGGTAAAAQPHPTRGQQEEQKNQGFSQTWDSNLVPDNCLDARIRIIAKGKCRGFKVSEFQALDAANKMHGSFASLRMTGLTYGRNLWDTTLGSGGLDGSE